LSFQLVRPGDRHSYKDFSIVVDPDSFGMTRDELAEALSAENIDTRKYYEPPVHRQLAYQKYRSPDEALPNTELLSSRSLSLPIWSSMTVDTALNICEAVARIHEFAGEITMAAAK